MISDILASLVTKSAIGTPAIIKLRKNGRCPSSTSLIESLKLSNAPITSPSALTVSAKFCRLANSPGDTACKSCPNCVNCNPPLPIASDNACDKSPPVCSPNAAKPAKAVCADSNVDNLSPPDSICKALVNEVT